MVACRAWRTSWYLTTLIPHYNFLLDSEAADNTLEEEEAFEPVNSSGIGEWVEVKDEQEEGQEDSEDTKVLPSTLHCTVFDTTGENPEVTFVIGNFYQ